MQCEYRLFDMSGVEMMRDEDCRGDVQRRQFNTSIVWLCDEHGSLITKKPRAKE
jgi:hypothetical protein